MLIRPILQMFRSHICLFDKLYSSIISIEKFVIPFPSRLIDFRHERVEVYPLALHERVEVYPLETDGTYKRAKPRL